MLDIYTTAGTLSEGVDAQWLPDIATHDKDSQATDAQVKALLYGLSYMGQPDLGISKTEAKKRRHRPQESQRPRITSRSVLLQYSLIHAPA